MLRTLTKENILDLKTSASPPGWPAFTKACLAVLGLKHPLPSGWIEDLVGKSIPEEVYQEALSKKDHVTPKTSRSRARRNLSPMPVAKENSSQNLLDLFSDK